MTTLTAGVNGFPVLLVQARVAAREIAEAWR
jgi:hypothetical protein